MGHDELVHSPLLYITVPIGSCFDVSPTSHMCLELGRLFVEALRYSQSISLQYCSYRVSIVFRWYRRGLENRYLSLCFAMSVQIFRPNSFCYFPIGYIGVLA